MAPVLPFLRFGRFSAQVVDNQSRQAHLAGAIHPDSNIVPRAGASLMSHGLDTFTPVQHHRKSVAARRIPSITLSEAESMCA